MGAKKALRGTLIVLFVMAALPGCEEGELRISEVVPRSGIVGGNEQIELQGEGFEQGMGVEVFFGPNKSPSVVVEGSNLIKATTPPSAKAGPVDIRLQTDRGKNIVLPGVFLYVESQNFNLTDGFGSTKTKSN